MHTLTHRHTHTHPHTHTHTHTHKHTYISHGSRTEEQVLAMRKLFNEDFKELTEVAWWTQRGSWLQAAGGWLEKERWPLDLVFVIILLYFCTCPAGRVGRNVGRGRWRRRLDCDWLGFDSPLCLTWLFRKKTITTLSFLCKALSTLNTWLSQLTWSLINVKVCFCVCVCVCVCKGLGGGGEVGHRSKLITVANSPVAFILINLHDWLIVKIDLSIFSVALFFFLF